MLKILIINPFGVGDVLFTTPLISNIKDTYPESIIGYWCNERVEGVLKDNPRIDKIFALSRGDIKKIYAQSKLNGIRRSLNLFSRIKKEKFDISFDFSLDHRYGFISWLSGIKNRLGFNYKRRGFFLTDKIDLEGYTYKHVVEYYLDLLKLIHTEPKRFNLELYVPDADRIRSRKILNGYGINSSDLLIGIAPGAGASWGKDALLKHWPAEKFAQLGDRLINGFDAKILILGDQSERPIAAKVVAEMKKKAVDLVGKTSLEELIAIMDTLQILITNDGGPLHMAVALGKKTLSFFGPVDPKVYGPYPPDQKRHIVLKGTLECIPCYRNFSLAGCQKNKECLKNIGVDEALAAVTTLLS